MVATTYGMSSRWRSLLTYTAIDPKTDSRNTQNMIEPFSPPQYAVILYQNGWNVSDSCATYLIVKSSVRNALTMTAVATAIRAATRYSPPTPLSISRREPRRAPMTDATAAYAQTTNEARRRKVPRLAITYDPAGARPAASYFEGHFAI